MYQQSLKTKICSVLAAFCIFSQNCIKYKTFPRVNPYKFFLYIFLFSPTVATRHEGKRIQKVQPFANKT